MNNIIDLTGCIVELLEMHDSQAPEAGTLGSVTGTGRSPYGETIQCVRWENGSDLSLLENDRYKILTGNKGFTRSTLLDYAYTKYAEKWREKHEVTDECIKKTYKDWEAYLTEGVCEPLTFSDYIQIFGYADRRGEVQVSKNEFEHNEFEDHFCMETLLSSLAFDAWKKLNAESTGKEKRCYRNFLKSMMR